MDLLFNLKKEYIVIPKTKWGVDQQSPPMIALPSGNYPIRVNTMGSSLKKNYTCGFLDLKTTCVLIEVGFAGINVCGDILITLVELGYDLNKKDDWKKAKNNKDSIVKSYNQLVEKKPDLFDENIIDGNIQEVLSNEVTLKYNSIKKEQEKKKIEKQKKLNYKIKKSETKLKNRSAEEKVADKKLLKTGIGFVVVLFILFRACSGGGKPDPCDCTILYMSRAYSDDKELWDDCKYYYNNTAKVELECGKQEGRFNSN